MKVAIFVHCFFPNHYFGTETYTLDLARNLQALGHEPTVVTGVFPGAPPLPSDVHRYSFEGIRVVAIDKSAHPHTRVKDTYYQPEMRPALERVLDELAPDLVHVTHLLNHTAVLLDVLSARAMPVVATFTDFFGFCYNNRLEAADGSLCAGPDAVALNCLACHLKATAPGHSTRLVRRFLSTGVGTFAAAGAMRALTRLSGQKTGYRALLVEDLAQRPRMLGTLYKRYDAVITPSRFLRSAYERNGMTNPVTSIRFGVDIDRSPKVPRPLDAPLVVGFIGQIAPHKGTDLLIDAARAGLGSDGYVLKIYGSMSDHGAFSDDLRRRAVGLPVHFAGTFPKEKMREVLDDMDVLVIPSRWYENSPLVLLNALASHTPVVVADVEGMTEFLENASNGFTFTRGNIPQLAALLSGFKANPTRLRDMSATTGYLMTTKLMAERTLEVYREAIERRAPWSTASLPAVAKPSLDVPA